jgi:hypothetical protein
MPSRGPTLPQKQKKASSNGKVHPDAYQDTNIRNRYIDSAKVLELKSDWQTSLAIRIFGPELMGSIAFALDSLAQFKNSYRKISTPTRRQRKGTSSLVTGSTVTRTVDVYSNWGNMDADPGFEIVPEFLVSTFTETFDYNPVRDQIGIPQGFDDLRFDAEEYLVDSTQEQRYEGQEGGEMAMLKDISARFPTDNYTTIDTLIDYSSSAIYSQPDLLYERYVTTTNVINYGNHLVPLNWIYSGQGYVDSLFSNYLRQGILAPAAIALIPKALANKRFFDAFRQIGELKDLPELIKGVRGIISFFEKVLRTPLSQLSVLDKRLSDAYLTYLFGYKSLKDAVEDLLKTPEKIAKHINYILSKNNKVFIGKSGFDRDITFEDINDPYPYWYQPFGGQLLDESDSVSGKLVVRCTVNQTIAFPPVMVPKFSDSNYRDFLGLNPRVVDFYNLISFTWLLDWYLGAGKYLDLITAVVDDRLLVNFGYMAIDFSPIYKHSATLKVVDTNSIQHADGSYETEETNIRLFDWSSEYRFTAKLRYDISRIDGVKDYENKNGNLSDSQFKILGALLTKFT